MKRGAVTRLSRSPSDVCLVFHVQQPRTGSEEEPAAGHGGDPGGTCPVKRGALTRLSRSPSDVCLVFHVQQHRTGSEEPPTGRGRDLGGRVL